MVASNPPGEVRCLQPLMSMMPRTILPPDGAKGDLVERPGAAASRAATRAVAAGAGARLRRRRSASYVEVAGRLDVGPHRTDAAALATLLEAIASEFPDLTLEQRPLGIVAACHLGPPFQVHLCDLSGGILEHFEANRPMPPPFERARSLALHPSYCLIEVYTDTLRAIGRDGTVSFLESAP